MAYVSVKATADASSYQAAMRQMTTEMKALSSAYAATEAKTRAFGQQSDVLKNKQKELNDKIKLQKEIVKTAGDQYQKLSQRLQDQKAKHAELTAKVEDTRRAYEQSKEATGENSEETKKLKEELTRLESELKASSASIEKTEVALNKQAISANRAEEKLTGLESELESVNRALENQKMEVFAAKCETCGDKMQAFGKKMTVVSTGIAAFVVGSAKAAIDFETAFTGVTKTCDEVYDKNGKLVYSYEDLKNGIRNMSKELPASTTEISAVAEAAGQLGIKTQDILGFTKTMINMGESTNLSSEVAATSLAKFANITGLAADTSESAEKKYSRLGSTIVALGNNSATTEADIVEMGMRIAGAGKQVGMTDAEIMALAASLSSVGIEAEAGGTAISTVMSNIDKSVATNGKSLATWASTAGMSSEQFKAAWQNDVTGTLQRVIQGMSDAKAGGENLNLLLDELGVTSLRQTDVMKRMSNASDILNDSVDLANSSWEENSALTQEAEKRYQTVESQMSMLKNEVYDLGISFGEHMIPAIRKGVSALSSVCEWFSGLSDEQQKTIIKIGLFVAAIGPAVTILGKLTTGAGKVVKAYMQWKKITTVVKGCSAAVKSYQTATAGASLAAGVMNGNLTKQQAVIGGLGTKVGGLVSKIGQLAISNPWTIAAAGAAALAVAVYKAYQNTHKETIAAQEFSKQAEKNVQTAKAQGKQAEFYAQKLEELSQKENKSAQDKKLIQAYVDKLNGSVEGLNLKYDAEKDKLNQSTEAIHNKIAAMRQEAIQAAYIKNSEEALDKYTKKYIELEEAQSNLKASQEEWNSLSQSEQQVRGDLRKKIEQQKAAVDDLKNATSEYWQEYIKQSNKAAMESGQWDKLVEDAKKAGIKVPKSLKEGLNEGKYAIPTTVDELNALIEFDKAAQNATGDAQKTVQNLQQQLSAGEITVEEASQKLNEAITKQTGKAADKADSDGKRIKDSMTNNTAEAANNTSVNMSALQTSVASKMAAAAEAASGSGKTINNSLSNDTKSAAGSASTNMSSINSSVASKMSSAAASASKNAAKIGNDTARETKNAATQAETNMKKVQNTTKFSWSLPKLKMPHFSVTGKFSVAPPSVPHFSIKWYAKAMNNPMLLDSATIFGMEKSGNLLGAGEAGEEVVSGANTLMNMIREAVSSESRESIVALNNIAKILEKALPLLIQGQARPISIDGKELINKTGDMYYKKMGEITASKNRRKLK